jgi:hypothetical protein
MFVLLMYHTFFMQVLDGIVQMIEEGEKKKGALPDDANQVRVNRTWISIEHSGMNFRGKFVPSNEFDANTVASKLSPEAKVNFEAWLRETTTLMVNTEINVQLGEFTIKRHTTQPLDTYIQDHPDFVQVFQHVTKDDVIQCAEVKHTVRRKWVRLVGRGYDIQLWDSDDRQPRHTFTKTYVDSAPTWVKEVFEPWRERILNNVELYLGPSDSRSADILSLIGVVVSGSTENGGTQTITMKEVVVHKYPRVFHVYNLIEHGRRWYRSLIFSSSSALSMHTLEFHSLNIGNSMQECCGNPTVTYTPAPSLIVLKYIEEDVDNAQMYLPKRLLHGTLPTALLEAYDFWQNYDDSITGYMVKGGDYFFPNSVLRIQITKGGRLDSSGFGFSDGFASIRRHMLIESDSGETVESAVDVLQMLNPFAVFAQYDKAEYGVLNAPVDATKTVRETNTSRLRNTVHSLLKLILRLEPISHVILWSKVSNKHCPGTIDLIELPRLRLTFERKELPNGKVRYYVVEQKGFYIAELSSMPSMRRLLNDFSNAVLLRNSDGECLVLMSATAKPRQIRIKAEAHAYKLMFALNDETWINNCGENTYFIYTIHASGSHLQSKSVASTFFLLVLYLLTRNYREAFKLIESCVCDRSLTPLEQQVYEVIWTLKDVVPADFFACRLKLFFISYGCMDIMPYQSDVEEDYRQYLNQYSKVSSYCRLKVDEEVFIMSKIPADSSVRSVVFTNRERIIKVSFDSAFQQSLSKLSVKNFAAEYAPLVIPEPYMKERIDLDLLDVDRPTFKNILQKLSFPKYNKLEPCSGPDCIKFLHEVFSKDKNVGFFVIYELFTNTLLMSIIPDADKPRSIATLLLRALPETYITGVQRVILHLLETHEELCPKMPQFEDKRKLKLPTLSGLDIFQTHIKTVASALKSNMRDFNHMKIYPTVPAAYKPPGIVVASSALKSVAENPETRVWFTPRIIDYNCEKRVISRALIPDVLPTFTDYYDNSTIRDLSQAPLFTESLKTFVRFKPSPIGQTAGDGLDDKLRVMKHPSSQSHIARTSVARLEQDMKDFAVDEHGMQMAVIASVPEDVDNLTAENLMSLHNDFKAILTALEDLKAKDADFARKAVPELLDLCNGRHASYSGNVTAQGYSLLQFVGSETYLVSISLSVYYYFHILTCDCHL